MNVFSLEIRNTRRSVIAWTISVGCVIVIMLAFFPSMQTESMQALAGAKLEGIDPALLAALGLGLKGVLDFTIITNFFGYVLQCITLAVMVYATQHAVTLLVKEETDGTIEFLYAKPVSRSAIFFQKLLAQITLYTAMLFAFFLITTAGYLAVSDFSFAEAAKESATFYGAILFVGLIFMAVGVLLSALIKTSKGASSVTIAIVFGTFIIGVMSVLIENLDFLIYFSPMDWIKTQKLMTDGILVQEWAVGIGVILVSLAGAYLKYRKRDLLV